MSQSTVLPEARLPVVGPPAPAPSFLVVFVCVDHRSRTVLAERLLRTYVAPDGADHLDIVGAGGHKTHAEPGIDPSMVAELARRGLGTEVGPVRRLTAEHLASADLVLTFEREHRTEVFQYAARMMTHCFTLTELATIVQASPDLLGLTLDERVVAASRRRDLGRGAPDVPATWKQPAQAHRTASHMIAEATEVIAPFLAMRPS